MDFSAIFQGFAGGGGGEAAAASAGGQAASAGGQAASTGLGGGGGGGFNFSSLLGKDASNINGQLGLDNTGSDMGLGEFGKKEYSLDSFQSGENKYSLQSDLMKKDKNKKRKEKSILDGIEIPGLKAQDVEFEKQEIDRPLTQRENRLINEGRKKNRAAKYNQMLTQFGGPVGDLYGDIGMAFSTTAESREESMAQTVSLASKGAKIGGMVAPGIGHAAGAIVGGAVGVVDWIGDSKKRKKNREKEIKEMFERKKSQRERDYRIEKGERFLAGEMAIAKQQNGLY